MEQETQSKLSRRQFVSAGAGATGLLFLTACGGGDDDNAGGGNDNQPAAGGDGKGGGAGYDGPAVKLAFWNGFTGGDGPMMGALVKKFSAENKNIQVSQNTVQWADYYQKVPAAVASGRGPDIGIMHVDQLATNAARNVIMPLDDVAQSVGLKEEDFAPEVWAAGMYKDQRFGIPLDMHPLAQYTNNAFVGEKAPTNRQELEAAIQAAKGKGVQQPFWMPSRWPAHMIFETLTWQNGGEIWSEDAKEAQFNSPEAVEALTWMQQAAAEGWSPKNVAADANYIAFKNKKNAITWDGIWQINDLAKDPNMKFQATPVPQIFDQKAVWGSSHQFVIMKARRPDENKVNASKVFINWISQQSVEWAKAGQIPARNEVRESAEFKAIPQVANLAVQIEYVRFPPSVPGIGDVRNQAMEQAVIAVMTGQKQPKAALDEGVQKANSLLEENAKKYGA